MNIYAFGSECSSPSRTCFRGLVRVSRYHKPSYLPILTSHTSLIFGSPDTWCFLWKQPQKKWGCSEDFSSHLLEWGSSHCYSHFWKHTTLPFGGAPMAILVIRKDPLEIKNSHKIYLFSLLWNSGSSVSAHACKKIHVQENYMNGSMQDVFIHTHLKNTQSSIFTRLLSKMQVLSLLSNRKKQTSPIHALHVWLLFTFLQPPQKQLGPAH